MIKFFTNGVLCALLVFSGAQASEQNNPSILNPASPFPSEGIFKASSCSPSGNTTHCIAVGRDHVTYLPLLVQSIDGGNRWTMVDHIAQLPAYGNFYASSCVPLGKSTQCIAAGVEIANNDSPLLVQSTDGGNHWAVVDIAGRPNGGLFYTSSCTVNGSTTQCIAAGKDYVTGGAPLLTQSIDGGHHWAVVNIPKLPSDGIFYASSCASHEGTVQCIASGQNFTNGSPLLVQSINGGQDWTIINQ